MRVKINGSLGKSLLRVKFLCAGASFCFSKRMFGVVKRMILLAKNLFPGKKENARENASKTSKLGDVGPKKC